MSLILEALKKSEQQRRLGEAPTLDSPVLAVQPRRSLLPLIAALIAFALLVGWWLLRSPAVAPPQAAVPIEAAPHIAASPPMSRIKPAAPAAAPKRAAEPRHEMPQVNPGATVAPPLPIRAPLEDRPGSVTTLPVPAPSVATTPAAAPRPSVQMPPAAPAAPVPAAPPASAAANTPPAAAQPTLPSLWELPYATRKDLPDLTLMMHVYAPDPHERFVVIRGERHVEGDDLGGGVVLREIRADGMVLEYKGTRFLYPRG